MIVLPTWLNEYSTATAFDLVTCLVINPVDSRLRRVLVSMRCETLPMWRRNSPYRWGRSLSENKILGVHLPMKIDEPILDSCVVFMPLFFLRKRLREETFRICLSRLCFTVGTIPACQFLRSRRN